MLATTFNTIGLIIFLIFLAIQLIYVVVSFKKIIQGKTPLAEGLLEDKISIIVPAYNEAKVLENCIQGTLNLTYKNYNVIFINDGSTDDSLEVLKKALDMEKVKDLKPKGELSYACVKGVYQSKKYKNFIVIDKENGGKADSLNAGIDYAEGDIIVTLDADSVLKQDSLNYMNQAFKDQAVVAAGGAVLAGQMYRKDEIIYPKSALMKYQLSNYVSAFFCRKVAQSSLNALTVVSGAFGSFRSAILREAQGFKKTLGEDMEITMNIQKLINTKYKDQKMIYVQEAVCYTEVPENFRDLMKQKIRWQKGFLDCLMKYKSELFESFSVKFLLFLLWDSFALGISGSVAVALLPIILVFSDIDIIFILILVSSLVVQYIITIISYINSSKLGFTMKNLSYCNLIVFTLIEIFTYRFLDTVSFVYGSMNYFLSKEDNWNKLDRTGNVATVTELGRMESDL